MNNNTPTSATKSQAGIRIISLSVPAGALQDGPDFRVATSFDEAEGILEVWGMACRNGVVLPVSFEIQFDNELVYRGRFGLTYGGTDNHDRLLREAVFLSVMFGSGRAKPERLSQKQYDVLLRRLGDLVHNSARIVDECLLVSPLWG